MLNQYKVQCIAINDFFSLDSFCECMSHLYMSFFSCVLVRDTMSDATIILVHFPHIVSRSVVIVCYILQVTLYNCVVTQAFHNIPFLVCLFCICVLVQTNTPWRVFSHVCEENELQTWTDQCFCDITSTPNTEWHTCFMRPVSYIYPYTWIFIQLQCTSCFIEVKWWPLILL